MTYGGEISSSGQSTLTTQNVAPNENVQYGSVVYQPRLTEPSFNNKYWVKKGRGGINVSIIPNPVKGQVYSPSNLPNCVGYAWGRAYEIAIQYNSKVPAYAFNNPPVTWRKNLNKWAMGIVPRLGAMIIFKKVGTVDKGHISVVERIVYDNSGQINYIVLSESGYPTPTNKWGNPPKYKRWQTAKVYKSKGYNYGTTQKFMGFMYPPYCALFSKDAGAAWADGNPNANGYCGLSIMTVYVLNPETGQYEPAQGTGNSTYNPSAPGFDPSTLEDPPAPTPAHNAGNKVRVKGVGNTSKLGTGKEVNCLGATYQIKSIHLGFPYAYRVGDDKRGIGYFREEDLEKI